MKKVLIGLRMPYHDPLEKIIMENAAEVALREEGVTATVKVVGAGHGYIAAQDTAIEVAEELAKIAEAAARGIYDRSVP